MTDAAAELELGRRSYADGAWRDAYESLSGADEATPLGAGDLELLARAAYMLGGDDDYVSGLERAHHAHLDAGDAQPAVRCAVWIGHNLLFRGEHVRASGWFGRAQRLLEADGHDSVERGYLLIPVWLEQMGRGDFRSRLRDRRRGGRDRGALRRSGPHVARQGRGGSCAREAGAGRRGPAARGRGAGGGPRGRAVADRHRHRLLQHDCVLPGRV